MTLTEAAGTSYADEVMVPVLVCPGCGSKVLLPFRRFVDSLAAEPYWPPRQDGFDWICDVCRRNTRFGEDDLLWFPESGLSSPPAERGFWRVEIPCGHKGCTATVVTHTQTFGRTSRRELGLMVARSLPTPVCDDGHSIAEEHSYPQRVDFVEWSGAEDYLV